MCGDQDDTVTGSMLNMPGIASKQQASVASNFLSFTIPFIYLDDIISSLQLSPSSSEPGTLGLSVELSLNSLLSLILILVE